MQQYIMAAVRKVLFHDEATEYKGINVLVEAGSTISYLGDRKYVISEDDCRALKSRSVDYTPLE